MKSFDLGQLFQPSVAQEKPCRGLDAEIDSCYTGLLRAVNDCEGFDAVDELRHALKHTRTMHFGKTKKRLTPLSRQVKHEIRDLFPIDYPAFNLADKTKGKIERRTVILRLSTIFVFLAYLALILGATQDFLGVSDKSNALKVFGYGLPGLPSIFQGFFQTPLGYVIYIFVISVFAIAARRTIREFFFMAIHRFTGQFAHDLDSRWDCIDTRVTECCLAAQKRGANWTLRSNLYTIIAIWNAKRAEYLDRYSTVSAWKIHDFVMLVEYLATGFKFLLALGVFGWVAYLVYQYHEIQNLRTYISVAAIFVALAATAVGGFLLYGRVRNDKWTEIIRSDIAKSEETDKHHFLKLGELVENLSRTVLEVQHAR